MINQYLKLNYISDYLKDTDYPGQDIAVSLTLTLKLKNLIKEYLYNKLNSNFKTKFKI